MENNGIELKIKPLENLVAALRVAPPSARVGILGKSTGRSNGGPTNAEIGAAHEFGTSTIPMRSFLRIPISQGLDKELQKGGLFSKKELNQVIKDKSLKPWVEKLAIAAEACVMDAFDSSGNGEWPAWKNPKYTNNTGQLLVDTGQLRRSITSEVK